MTRAKNQSVSYVGRIREKIVNYKSTVANGGIYAYLIHFPLQGVKVHRPFFSVSSGIWSRLLQIKRYIHVMCNRPLQ